MSYNNMKGGLGLATLDSDRYACLPSFIEHRISRRVWEAALAPYPAPQRLVGFLN